MFDRMFKANNPFWQSMGTVYDLFIVNTLWLLCSLPVVTAGAAATAACYALTQRLLGEGSTIRQDFFRSFKLNFRQGTLLGLIFLATGAFLMLDIWLCHRSGTGIYTFFMFFFGVIFLFWAMTALYAFPLLAKFDRSTKDILIWAFTLALSNLPMTLMMLFVIAVSLWLIHIVPGLIFIMFGLAAQFCVTIMVSIFRPWLPKPGAGEPENSGLSALPNMNDLTKEDPEFPKNDPYADFDETSFYGEDPEEVKKLLAEASAEKPEDTGR